MPELPEVEVCRQGIEPHVLNRTVANVIVRNSKMRWPITPTIDEICGEKIMEVSRRAKYLLIKTAKGTLVLHLGMSGTIRVIPKDSAVSKHDHFDLVLNSGMALRLNDPRRFGAVLWLTQDVAEHPLLAKLGPEPLLNDTFIDGYLFKKSRNKTVPVKTFIMNNHVVVGVGNIYANEALFQAGILPTAVAGKISQKRYNNLTDIIKKVLAKAINQGGTTLKDFTQADGRPGYFAQSLQVYGRGGEKCVICESVLKEIRQSGRASVFCPQCQKS
ncbi:bifunctional DNA-formamidopyrimidine glycosylase/DNA-(apurinic or apyrimidinic site) lyase [Thalassotalea sp. ND16A]|uniref:bifunctional DNA-formamidopyrimidine glycosylase/DNA-(apurinic or apyrimidinic site) lyase n=1 Tax=Thalassotalea sp. ND16A TaxID=1535422 RepID=UPI00051A85A6|nr:bifunctional DNA-formamidopyrimidine glycosylase/DNA-(apurinic or apyrimidinic site) lyase [Thalassotalea sp. ND16A]KGJ92194.1 DNA-formamidopyrimidine glycosylase [Thalassotalea sp. ND16A]